MRPLKITRDVQGFPTSGTQMILAFPESTQTVKLTHNTVKSLTVPTLGSPNLAVLFTFTTADSLLVSPYASPTLVLPTGTVTLDVSELILNGSGREVKAGQTLQLLAPDADTFVTLSYYEINQA